VEDARARATLWSQTLDTDMPVSVAGKLVTWHYKESTDGVMPAHINRLWRQHRRNESEANRAAIEQKQASDVAALSVPMPPEVKEKLMKTLKTTRTP
jgi:predicted nucleic acid-binding protein